MNKKDYKNLSIKYSKKYYQQKIFNDLIGGSFTQDDGTKSKPTVEQAQREYEEMGLQLPQGETQPQPLSLGRLGRQSSISPTQTIEVKQGQYTKDIDQFPGNETEYFKGIKQKINYNEQFVGFDSNNFEFNSIDNEMLYHQVPHFNDNNKSTTFSTNILEVLKREGNDEDYFANSFIKEDKSIKEYNKASFENEQYKLLERITNSIVNVTNDYRNNNTKEELDKTMFLFGIPSENIINLLRLIVQKYIIKDNYSANLQMMTGFVEINEPEIGNIILISISEGTFNMGKNVFKLLEFLQSLNLELEIELPNRNMRRSKYYNSYIENFYNEYITRLTEELKFFMTRNNKGEYILTSGTPTFKFPKIRFVFSHKYNADRYNGFESHVPAKKSQKCNNGSTCVEPKLFSYISDLFNTNYPSQHIIGSVAYWFNGIKPTASEPGCAGGKYCFEKYDTEITTENILTKQQKNSHVRSLMARMINNKVGYDLINVKKNEGENTLLDKGANYVTNDVDEFVLHGFALPCPGCQLNYFNFLLNKKDYWNHLFCKEKVFDQETAKIRPIIEREISKIEGQAEEKGQDRGDLISGLKNFSSKK